MSDRRVVRRLLTLTAPVALLVVLAAPSHAVSAEPYEVLGAQAPAHAQKKARENAPRPGALLTGIPEVRLAPLDTAALLAQDRADAKSAPLKAQRFAVARPLAIDATRGLWQQLADGRALWAIDVTSSNAVGLRLHFTQLALPAGAELAVYAAGDAAAPAEVYRAPLARHELWTGLVGGQSARVELVLPAGQATARLPFVLDAVLHAYLDPLDDAALAKAAGTCENDATCHPEWAGPAAAVARIDFVQNGQGYLCTGQLLNDLAQDFTPYFLTANHCISKAAVADTTEFFWFYQTASCNAAPPSPFSVPRSQEGQLLATNPSSDYTLMMVLGALPDGLYWQGWTAKPVPNGAAAVAIHHPAGDFKRISFGNYLNDRVCQQDAGTSRIALTRIAWSDGVTEGGSSGSGILRADNGQLFGQLFFGPSTCSAPEDERYDCYGSFSKTYTGIKRLLAAGSDDKSEQNDSCAKSRLVKVGQKLTNRIVKVTDSDWYKISVPARRTVDVDAEFLNSRGDVDLEVFTACGADPFFTSDGTGDFEGVAVSNNGSKTQTVYVHVYLSSSTRNTYALETGYE